MKVAVAKFVLLSCSLAMMGVTQAAAQEERLLNIAPVAVLDENATQPRLTPHSVPTSVGMRRPRRARIFDNLERLVC